MSNAYLEKMFSLEGVTAVITGGGGFLGGEMGLAMVQAGAKIVLWDIRDDVLQKRADHIKAESGAPDNVSYVVADLMSEESIQKALDESVGKVGEINMLLNACGGNRGKAPLVDTDMEQFEFVLKLNLMAGCFTPTKMFGKYWIDNKIKGNIVNIASMAGLLPLSGVWAYSAAKAAVINQTQAAAKEYAPHGIRVNAIAPGFFLADQNRALLIDEKTGDLTPRGQDVIAHTPFGRFGDPKELCGVCLYLCSREAAGFVSGATIPVDGAYMCQNI